jgi:hypothetical protein
MFTVKEYLEVQRYQIDENIRQICDMLFPGVNFTLLDIIPVRCRKAVVSFSRYNSFAEIARGTSVYILEGSVKL